MFQVFSEFRTSYYSSFYICNVPFLMIKLKVYDIYNSLSYAGFKVVNDKLHKLLVLRLIRNGFIFISNLKHDHWFENYLNALIIRSFYYQLLGLLYESSIFNSQGYNMTILFSNG